MMSEWIKKNAVLSCWVIFAILILVHGFEAIVLRTDETVLGENCINKMFGIVIMFIVLRALGWKGSDIGFSALGVVKSVFSGLLLGMASFVISYCVEIMAQLISFIAVLIIWIKKEKQKMVLQNRTRRNYQREQA